MSSIQIVSFYRFFAIDESAFAGIEKAIAELGSSMWLRGLFIMGVEGINSTFSIPVESCASIKTKLAKILCCDDFEFKDSFADAHPFHDLKIKVRSEIVTLARPDLQPADKSRHLSPEEWQKTLENEDVVVIDTRNSYEYDIGHFRGAIDPGTREFTEYPKFIENSGIAKDQKILIYCTGGIRCEKAILEMNERGFANVYQLDGGIISYLQKFSRRHFDGECFVFDYRVAVDQDLAPSSAYKLCPHCGQPAKEKVTCIQCSSDAVVCKQCLSVTPPADAAYTRNDLETCSKNCAHHFRMGHRSRRVHFDAIRARQAKTLSRS